MFDQVVFSLKSILGFPQLLEASQAVMESLEFVVSVSLFFDSLLIPTLKDAVNRLFVVENA